jgi:hypothetical protein
MINAGNQDIQIDQGADFELAFQLLDDDNEPVSLDLATIRGSIRLAPESAAATISFTGTVVSGEDGQGKVTLTGAQTATIPVDNSGTGKRKLKTYVYDIEAVYGDGKIQRILQGRCYISPEVTR